MSSDIAIPDNKPGYLANQSDNTAATEFSEGMAGGLALPVLSIRGKEFRFRFQGQEQSTREREMHCIMVASRPAVSKRYYEKGFSPGETSPPDCASTDGKVPDSGTNIQADKCSQCPHNVFGSRVTPSGKLGKACSDYKRLVVRPILGGALADQPVVLDIPATSLKTPKGYQGNDLFLREYLATLNRHGVPPTAAVTKLMFTDAEYPQLCFGFARYASEDEYSAVQTTREDDDVKDALSPEGVEPAAPIQQATDVAPQPAQPAAQPTQPTQPAEPTPQPEPAQPAQPEPEPTQPAVEPTPEPEPAAAAQPEPEPTQGRGSDDDPMDEVRKLLGGLS